MKNERLQYAKSAAIEFMTAFHPDREWWVVGGLLRDSDMGRPFKDVDIFINGTSADLLPGNDAELGDKNAYLLRAYTVEAYPYKGYTFEINLIFMRGDFWDLHLMTERCDLGICQIGWDPRTDEEYRSKMYVEDKANRTLTLARNTTKERWDRMQSKFPHHKARNPNGYSLDCTKFWAYDQQTSRLQVKFEQETPE